MTITMRLIETPAGDKFVEVDDGNEKTYYGETSFKVSIGEDGTYSINKEKDEVQYADMCWETIDTEDRDE